MIFDLRTTSKELYTHNHDLRFLTHTHTQKKEYLFCMGCSSFQKLSLVAFHFFPNKFTKSYIKLFYSIINRENVWEDFMKRKLRQLPTSSHTWSNNCSFEGNLHNNGDVVMKAKRLRVPFLHNEYFS